MDSPQIYSLVCFDKWVYPCNSSYGFLRFIQVSACIDSLLLFIAEQVFYCMSVPQLVYPILCVIFLRKNFFKQLFGV